MNKFVTYYRTMLLIRLFEETVEALFSRGLIKGTTHPAIGQEAVAVGACSALRRGDCITSTHRGHGHLLARGGDPCRIMAELFGKRTGYSRGRGGSQLMADYRLGFLGANGITGGSLPFATGVALDAQLRKSDRVTLCFCGDGASNQGTFHESLNLAGVWRLPVVFLCENNGYAMSTPVQAGVPVRDIAVRAAGYGFPGVIVDGNDLFAVRDAMAEACARARRGEGPTLIEAKTYRLSGHSRGDQRKYRTREEEAAARRNDPLVRFRKWLVAEGHLGGDEATALRREVKAAVTAAIRFARTIADPDPATLEQGVFA